VLSKNAFNKFLCRVGLHDDWYMPPSHPEWKWTIWTISGCDTYKCVRCNRVILCGYLEHSHDHKEPMRKVLK